VALGAIVLGVPFVLTQTHTDYWFDRNLLLAWVALAIALGAAMAVIPGWAASAAVLVIGVAAIATNLQVATSPSLQRDDWRHGVALLGKSPRSRVMVVFPPYATGMLPFYGVRSQPLSGTGITTNDLYIFGKVNANAPYPQIRGFRPIARRQLQGIGFFELQADQPLTIDPAWAQEHGILPAGAMVQFSPRAYAWIAASFRVLADWRHALTLLANSSKQSGADATAIDLLRKAEQTGRGSLLPAPLDIPNAAAITHSVVVVADSGAAWAATLQRLTGPSSVRLALKRAKEFDVAARNVPGLFKPSDPTATAITLRLSH
jgi:hypothetical protein